MEIICKEEYCTGCKACGDVCPVGAIEYNKNHEGFWYPKINTVKCINCGKCIKTCPQNNEPYLLRDTKKCLAAYSKEDFYRIQSTSGGLFPLFAEKIIEFGGSVYGCKYCDDYKGVVHSDAETKDEILALCGSKYVQSDTEGVYRKIAEKLSSGKRVLFCGTPCQVAALYKYLGGDNERLLTIDFICHGINSPDAYRAYIDEKEKEIKSKVCFVQMKNKKKGWKSLATYIRYQNGESTLQDRNEDMWIRGYISFNLYHRKSCFNCMYRKSKRKADITLGDYWGLDKIGPNDEKKGVSVVLINSDKGRWWIDLLKDRVSWKEGNLSDVINENPAIFYDPVEYQGRKVFFLMLKKTSFKSSYMTAMTVSKIEVHVSKMSTLIKNNKSWGLNTGKKHSLFMKMQNEHFMETVQNAPYFKDIDLYKTFYFNYICTQVKRKKENFIILYKNSVLDIRTEGKVMLCGGNAYIGVPRHKKSKKETAVLVESNGTWNIHNGCILYAGSYVEICCGARLQTGYFTINSGSVIVAVSRIKLGEDVMIARNVMIYDSDNHGISKNGKPLRTTKMVTVGDRVWIGTNSMVLKGVCIGNNTIIGAGTIVTKDIGDNTVVVEDTSTRILDGVYTWNRSNNRVVR